MRATLNRLRLRLTALTIVVGLGFVALLGGATYTFVGNYLESNVDLTLRSRMALEFFTVRAALPAELSDASQQWVGRRPSPYERSRDREEREDDRRPQVAAPPEGDLAAITVQFLDAGGLALLPVSPTETTTVSRPVDTASLTAALATGSDLRTSQLNGERVRVLTYRAESAVFDQPVLVQLYRPLANQDRILNGLLLTLLGVGALGAVVLGAGSWWLAGRSIQPAQQAWEQQQRFVANASHELRAPLTLIRASADVMQRNLDDIAPREPAFAEDQRALLGDVIGEVDHTATLVEDLLLLSRLDAHQLRLERESIDVPQLLADVQRQVQRVADDRGVRVRVEAAAGAAFADWTRVRQVLLILIDNALRHTPAGGSVTLESAARGATTDIAVRDTGEGIAADDLPRVFERFYQADAAHSTKGSAGLGLSIAKGLVEANGGRIAIDSRVGAGTRVVVSLPAGRIMGA